MLFLNKLSKKQVIDYLKTPRFWVFFILLCSPFLWFGSVYNSLYTRIDITQDKSLPQTFWVTYAPFDPDVHGYAMFKPTVNNKYTKDYVAKGYYLLKKVGCKEGDRLSTIGLNYYCNESFLGQAREFDSSMKRVDHFTFNGIIPKGYFFMLGTHPKSYDSRYFGFVQKDKLERGARPIW